MVRDAVIGRALAATLDPAALVAVPRVALATSEKEYHARLIEVMKRHSIVDPQDALGAAVFTGVELAVVCTSLDMESYGGRNEWGGDPGGDALPWEWFESPVTYPKWVAYWARVKRGYRVNGCGSMQLTDKGLQEAAQKLGGCWKQLPNRQVGAVFMRQLLKETGGDVRLAYQHYNGAGSAAILYGEHAYSLYTVWHQELGAVR